MSVQDTLNAIKNDVRLPTREEAAAAAEIIRLCNGADLSDWTDDVWPSQDLDEALRNFSRNCLT